MIDRMIAPAACLLLELAPHPAGVTPRIAIGDR